MICTNREVRCRARSCPAARARVMVAVMLATAAVLWLALSWEHPKLIPGALLLTVALFMNFRAYRRHTRP